MENGVVALEGAPNCRDIGGRPTRAGGRVRTDALYRSGRLSALTDDDLAELAGRGIRTVVDLRADSEVARDPSRLWSGVANFTSLPIAESAAEPVSLLDRILSGAITSMSESQMADVYITLLADNASQFARFATLAADVDNWPMLYHCTAGKDRTGLATALVLELCDVGREHVLDEYCATNEQHSYRRIEELRETLERAGVDLEAIRPLLMAPRPVLAGALAHLDDSYGGIEGFLVDAGGMGPTVPAEVRLNLVV